jgi:hypothetical protein
MANQSRRCIDVRCTALQRTSIHYELTFESALLSGDYSMHRRQRLTGPMVTKILNLSDEPANKLQPELQSILKTVGTAQYAAATASHFVTGGQYSSRRTWPRFAKM